MARGGHHNFGAIGHCLKGDESSMTIQCTFSFVL